MISEFSRPEWEAVYDEAHRKYEEYLSHGLNLDLSRGKPSSAQLNVTEGLLNVLKTNDDCFGENGVDYRNYGLLNGIPEARRLFAELFEVPAENVAVGGNSSLNMMYDALVTFLLKGAPGGIRPWSGEKIRWICPVPGYDRHFGICESLGIEMIPVETNEQGPDMDAVERLCAADHSIKGMWSVPKYSNPTGITYSDEVVRRLAKMKAAPDFRIFWDNAYLIHDLKETSDELRNLFDECVKAGNPDRVLMFTSTSKISFPGAGVAAMAMSKTNLDALNAARTYQTIGPDKLNQLRHVRYFKNRKGIVEHMKAHAKHLVPHFKIALNALDEQLKPDGYARWVVPNGGYFISLDLEDGCAKRVEELMKNAGVKITPAGSSFPYHRDPRDRNLRLAPTYPPQDELKISMDLFCLCIKLATAEKYLRK